MSLALASSLVSSTPPLFTAIWDYYQPEFVGFIRPGWLLIVSSSSAQISMGGRLNLDGGDAKSRWGDANSRLGGTRPPYNLGTAPNYVKINLLIS